MRYSLLLLVGLVVSSGVCRATEEGSEMFEPTIESLGKYECPEWFRDAKFGIYCHWNAQSFSESPDPGWYARRMYEQGHPAYEHHVKRWGHPSEVGYKDVVEAWTAEKFDAKEWVSLFKGAGAKYVVTMAVHHDNFDMWDSTYQPRWNSTNYGPKVDVCGEMRRETLDAGLRWGVSTHLARTYSWCQTNKGADETGPKAGVPYDGNNPEYEDLYLEVPNFAELGDESDQIRHPLKSPESWKRLWKARMMDLIDRYHPDHFYFDGASPFMDDEGQSGLDVIAHYYNHNASRHEGKNEGVMVIKDTTRHGYYYPGISSVVMERKRSNKIEPFPKQTENSVGPWFYKGEGEEYRSSKSLLHEMIDTVSKNNNYLLNIPPRGDGSIDDASKKILKDFGEWLELNGEAIYGSRPWDTFGEDGIRFTTHGKNLYAIVLDMPEPRFVIQSLKGWIQEDVAKVELIGGGNILWEMTDDGMQVSCSDYEESLAYVLRVSCRKRVEVMSYAGSVARPSAEDVNREAAKKYGADGDGGGGL